MDETLITGFWKRTLGYTEKIILMLTIFYFINWGVSVILILDAIHVTGNFSYLDTLITETSVTFRDIVGIAIIKFAVENIFKFNDFGGRIPSKTCRNKETGMPCDEGEFEIIEDEKDMG